MKKISGILFATIFMLAYSGISAQDFHLTSGGKTRTIKAGTFISLQLPVPGQKPCLKCDLNYMAGQFMSYTDGKLKLRLIHSDIVIPDGDKNAGYIHRNFKNETNQSVVEISTDSILTITKKGVKKLSNRTTGEKVGMFLVILGASNVLSAPLAEAVEKDGAVPFVLVGLSEIISGGIVGAAFSQKTLVTSPDFPQKRSQKKIWVIN
ncbi:MAG: hypothetical protein WBP41_06580 [Saprospiraceae bacterium]